MLSIRTSFLLGLALIGGTVLSGGASATVVPITPLVDLTTRGNQADINGGIVYSPSTTISLGSSGTGTFNPFYRVTGNGTPLQGYNTGASAVQYDTEKGKWTVDLNVSAIPVAVVDNVLYREFVLDINEPNSAAYESMLTLDQVVMFTTGPSQAAGGGGSVGGASYNAMVGPADPAANTFNFSTPSLYADSTCATSPTASCTATPIWEMNSAANSAHAPLVLNYANFTGSGKADMILLIPDANFQPYYTAVNASTGAPATAAELEAGTTATGGPVTYTTDPYLYLYSHFGSGCPGSMIYVTSTTAGFCDLNMDGIMDGNEWPIVLTGSPTVGTYLGSANMADVSSDPSWENNNFEEWDHAVGTAVTTQSASASTASATPTPDPPPLALLLAGLLPGWLIRRTRRAGRVLR